MLSPLQRRVATILRDLPEATGFALAGGAALIVRGQISRLTLDLDYFAVDPTAVDLLLPVFVGAVRSAGLTVIEERVVPGFARLSVADGPHQTGVDLATDARLLPAEPSDVGLVLSAEELAVDKVLAIFGRAEARDFVDLAAVEPRFGLEHLCVLASRKDAGFSRSVFGSMLARFRRLDRDEFDVQDEVFDATVEAVERWRSMLQDEGNG
ncbi:MAG: nucleotidyl transferase AbiEii/AbiGii toxin family protein [Acidimicrobiales bacterium]